MKKNNDIIIGIIGYKGTGKTFMADIIHRNLQKEVTDRNVIKQSFTKPIKEEVSWILGGEDFTKEELRPLYQTIGDLRRNKNINYYINKLSENVNKLYPSGKNVIIIDDVRFQNELEFCDIIVTTFKESIYKEGDTHISEQTEKLCIPNSYKKTPHGVYIKRELFPNDIPSKLIKYRKNMKKFYDYKKEQDKKNKIEELNIKLINRFTEDTNNFSIENMYNNYFWLLKKYGEVIKDVQNNNNKQKRNTQNSLRV